MISLTSGKQNDVGVIVLEDLSKLLNGGSLERGDDRLNIIGWPDGQVGCVLRLTDHALYAVSGLSGIACKVQSDFAVPADNKDPECVGHGDCAGGGGDGDEESPRWNDDGCFLSMYSSTSTCHHQARNEPKW